MHDLLQITLIQQGIETDQQQQQQTGLLPVFNRLEAISHIPIGQRSV